MRYKYIIEEEDFLNLQLFAASTSKSISNKKMLGWIIITAAAGVLSIFLYRQSNIIGASIMGFLALIIAMFYPSFYKWRYKNHYTKFVKKHYAKRFGEAAYIEIFKDYFVSKNKTGEGKIKIKDIDEVVETNAYLFFKISTGVSMHIPKQRVNNFKALKKTLIDRGIIIKENLDWKW